MFFLIYNAININLVSNILQQMIKVTIVAGARPNFIKIAPIIHAITKAKNAGHDINYRLIHTGQHYDNNKPS